MNEMSDSDQEQNDEEEAVQIFRTEAFAYKYRNRWGWVDRPSPPRLELSLSILLLTLAAAVFLAYWSKYSMAFKRVTPVLQRNPPECGLACVTMVANYFGEPIGIVQLADQVRSTTRGLTIGQMMNLFEQLGVEARPLRMELDQLATLQTPAVLHWGFTHFVVLEKVTKEYLFIVDPGSGPRRIPMSLASRHFTGVALECEKIAPATLQENGSRPLTLLQLIPKGRDVFMAIASVLATTIAINAIALLFPFFVKYSMETIIPQKNLRDLHVLLAAFSVVVVFQFLIYILRSSEISKFRRKISSVMSNEVFTNMIWADNSFFSMKSAPMIVSQYRSVNAITTIISEQILSRLLDSIAAVVGLAIVWYYSVILGGILTLSVGAYVLVHWRSAIELRSRQLEVIQSEANENAYFVDTVEAIQTIRLYSAEVMRTSGWKNIRETVEADYTSYGLFRARKMAVQDAIMQSSWLAVVGYCVAGVIAGSLSIALLTAMISWVGLITQKVRDAAEGLSEIEVAAVHVARLSDIISAKKIPHGLQHEGQPLVVPQPGGFSLKVEDLHFRYAAHGNLVLDGCSFDVPAGCFAVISGPSGEGKTTLLKTILGLLEPESGTLSISGNAVNPENRRLFNRQMGTVMQDDSLFQGTIIDNISFFDVEVDIEWARKCARIALISDDIEALPMKYDSPVGRKGEGFSGGQIQRILLARALYRRPQLLVLDEFTSNMDEDLELRIIRNLKMLGLTTLSVAHRRQVIGSADVILHLHDGVMVHERPSADDAGLDGCQGETQIRDKVDA